MVKADVWPVIHSEREALASDLETVPESAWTAQSLCSDWTVRDVVAHMAATAKMTPAGFFPKFVGSGFSLSKMQSKDIAAESGAGPKDTFAAFQTQVDSTGHPPGPIDTMLGETIIHAEDVRRPLRIAHQYPTDAVKRVADFYKRSNMVLGTKRRIDGLALRATDADWSYGAGPEVSGSIMSLLLAMTGRKSALENLAGNGVDVLRKRP